MAVIKRYHLPCPHETRQIRHDVEASDHHPLTEEEIAWLLNVAKETDDKYARNSIQIRLCQGIVGYTCPRPMDNAISQRERFISEFYLKFRYLGADPHLVQRLHEAMTSNDDRYLEEHGEADYH